MVFISMLQGFAINVLGGRTRTVINNLTKKKEQLSINPTPAKSLSSAYWLV